MDPRGIGRRPLLKSAAAGAVALAAPRLAAAADTRMLKFVPQADLTVTDPIMSGAFVTRNHAALVFDTLYGVDESLVARPQMVEGHVVEDGGKLWRLTLRDGLRFHDGTPVLARDVAASIRRWGARDSYGTNLIAATDEISAPSDKVVEFRLRHPFVQLPDALGKPGGSLPAIMPERLALTEPTAAITEVVGSGPFRYVVSERVPGARNVYERYEGYVPRLSGQPSFLSGPKIARFDRVEWITIPDLSTAAAALQSGEVDWLDQPGTDLLPLLQGQPTLVVELLETLGMFAMLRFNQLHPPFDNPAIRRALLAGLSQADHMTAALGDDKSMWRDKVGFFQPGSSMANDASSELLATKRDLDQVKRNLAAAGYKGEAVVLPVPADMPLLSAMSAVTADYLRKVGMNVDERIMDWGTEVPRLYSKSSPSAGGWSAACNYASGTAAVNPVAHTYLRGNGPKAMWGWPELPRIEALRDEWLGAGDEAGQKRIARDIQAQAFQDLPYMPLGAFYQPTAYRNTLKGVLKGFPIFWGVQRA